MLVPSQPRHIKFMLLCLGYNLDPGMWERLRKPNWKRMCWKSKRRAGLSAYLEVFQLSGPASNLVFEFQVVPCWSAASNVLWQSPAAVFAMGPGTFLKCTDVHDNVPAKAYRAYRPFRPWRALQHVQVVSRRRETLRSRVSKAPRRMAF